MIREFRRAVIMAIKVCTGQFYHTIFPTFRLGTFSHMPFGKSVQAGFQEESAKIASWEK